MFLILSGKLFSFVEFLRHLVSGTSLVKKLKKVTFFSKGLCPKAP